MFSKYIPAVSVLLLILLVAGAVLLWWPQYQTFSAKKDLLEARILELRQKEAYFANLEKIYEQIQNYKPELEKINSAIPTEYSLPEMYNFIKATAEKNGLILKNISQAKLGAPTGAANQGVSLSISIEGDYPGLKEFISALYQNIRLIEVKTMGFSSPKGTEGGLMTVNMQLTTPSYQKPDIAEGPFEFSPPAAPK